MAQIGSLIDNKYEILKQIGKGGMSVVYLAMDTRLNKQWAVKELQKNATDANNEVVIQSAIAEANMIKKLDHPSLPRIVDIIDEEDVIYVVMDYIEGQTLQYVVDEYGAQPQEEVIEWAIQLCDVLSYLHTRNPPIIYRDMKPGNIMLKPDGNIKLIDFGIAREYKEKNIADTVTLGTRGYAAPEQFGGKGQTDQRTDIYCLGVTLYHLLTGVSPAEPPYEIYPIRHWKPELSGGLENIILKCIQQNPENRYQSCAELLYALQHYEEEDDAFKAVQKKKLKQFSISILIAIVFLVGGIASSIIQSQLKSADYSENINLAQKANSDEEKRQYCIDAIEILPKESEAYLTLVDIYKSDAKFTVDESNELKEKVTPLTMELKNTDQYAHVTFEIGKLYWYYYDYGDNAENSTNTTRMQAAMSWFDDVVEYGNKSDDFYSTAYIYRDIATFYSDQTKYLNEGTSTAGMYKPYFENLQKIVKTINTYNDNQAIVKLDTLRLAVSSVELYANHFQKDGITQQQMTDLINTIQRITHNIQAGTDKNQEIKNYILERINPAKKAINHAFIAEVVEEE